MTRAQATSIDIGHHVVASIAGLTFNVDTLWSTALAMALVLALGFWVRRGLTAATPSKPQLFFELVTDTVQEQVGDAIGVDVVPGAVPLGVALFLLILFANWIELLPFGHAPDYIPPPSSDVNFTGALAVFVIIWVHIAGIRKRGARTYFRGFFMKKVPFVPNVIRLIEEIAKPVTLALRLFGNLFSGDIMLALIGLFPWFFLWIPNAIWETFDWFIGIIQAFIFALLTILYFSFALAEEGH
jgi:F-type H+-transporting ATPase subunit a